MRMIDRHALIESFKDTCQRFKDNSVLRDATLAMQADTRLFFPGFNAVNPTRKCEKPFISVVEDTTFHCAQGLLHEGKVAVLNFANAYTPGGGVTRGAMAQEECLCRSSNLYEGLNLPYLLKNYYKYNGKNTGDMGIDSVIYHPGVMVIKDDADLPEMLEKPFRVDVLTCAAPYIRENAKKPVPTEKLEDTLYRRIRNILEVAMAYNVDVIVLGAFGCGAFNNDPIMVAGIFRNLLVDKEYACFFRHVVFAIKRTRNNVNYEVFDRMLN